MKRIRFNTKVGTSRGLGAYRNKGSDYYEYASLFRDCSQMGRLDIINSLVDYSTTIYGSTSYIDTTEMYNNNNIHSTIWDNDYWLHEDIVSFRFKEERLKRVFNHIVDLNGMDFFETFYTPIYWDNGEREGCKKDFAQFADKLVHERCCWNSVELYNFALRVLKDGRRIMYGRNKWLFGFESGRNIINYYRMARKRNFNKVYKF